MRDIHHEVNQIALSIVENYEESEVKEGVVDLILKL